MTTPIKIAPSILAADFSRLGEMVACASQAGADWIHIDVMDGHFVPPITIGADMVAALRPYSDLPFDVHLMVEDPEKHIDDFANAGANIISCHPEATPHIHRTLQKIRDRGCQAGLVLNPGTPAHRAKPLLDMVDLILVMSVNPGFGGQSFLTSQLAKLRDVRAMIDQSNNHIQLEIDGGIKKETAPLAANAGADILVAGTAVFQNEDNISNNIRTLRKVATREATTKKTAVA